jgi:hypothetical protein
VLLVAMKSFGEKQKVTGRIFFWSPPWKVLAESREASYMGRQMNQQAL